MFMFQAYQSLNIYLEDPVVQLRSTISTINLEKNLGITFVPQIGTIILRVGIKVTAIHLICWWDNMKASAHLLGKDHTKIAGIMYNKIPREVLKIEIYEEVFLFFQAYSFHIFALIVELGSALGLWLAMIFYDVFYIVPI